MESTENSEQNNIEQGLKILGDPEILMQYKTAYFCSERFHPQAVFASYDWAEQMRAKKHCVISGFQSRIEADVLDILLRGDSPIILVLARSIYTRIPKQYQRAAESGNLLILSPFSEKIPRANHNTAFKRNCWIIRHTEECIIGSLTPGGQLEKAIKETGITPIFL